MSGKRIYFVRRSDNTGPIKIGCSAKVEQRVRQLCSDYRAEFRVLATVAGDFVDERNLHLKLAQHRVEVDSKRPGSSEWFHPSPTVLRVLGHVVATGEIPFRKADCRERIFAERYLAGETLKQIGDDHGITRERVRQILRRAGVESLGLRPGNCKQKHVLSENEIAAAGEYANGVRPREIREKYGLKYHQLREATIRLGIERKGPGAWSAKFDASRVTDLYRRGVPIKQIADTCGLSHTTYIYRLIRRHGVTPERMPASGRHSPRQSRAA